MRGTRQALALPAVNSNPWLFPAVWFGGAVGDGKPRLQLLGIVKLLGMVADRRGAGWLTVEAQGIFCMWSGILVPHVLTHLYRTGYGIARYVF